MKFFNCTFFLFVIILISCKNKTVEKVDHSKMEVIKVHSPLYPMDQKDFFSSWKLVPLETNKNSVIGAISRIISFNNRYYILDKTTNSVFIFTKNGAYLNKIQKLGKGPGEYVGLMDFCIDEKDKQVILYSHRPYKLLNYDLDGNFLKEHRLNRIYSNISTAEDKILFINKKPDDGPILRVTDKEVENEKNYLSQNDLSKQFQYFRLIFPSILKSLNTYIYFPYCDTLYQYKDKTLRARFVVDFEKKLPSNIYNKNVPPGQIYHYATYNNCGFAIANFKETKDNIYFSYAANTLVVYSKKTKQTITPQTIFNNESHLEFGNIFASDGNDNDLVTTYSAYNFKKKMDDLKANEVVWNRMPDSLKQIYNKITNESNPLLIVYTLK